MPGVQDRVIVVTGAGGGLGREYALTLAREGASVVVNDLGGARDGTGAGHNMADEVVKEIKDAGGRAVANYDSVAESEGAANIIKTAIDEFGKVDGVVSNAGILRDGTFHKMEFGSWDSVIKVHLYGGYNVIRAAWPHFRENGFGRVVVATSTSGLFGNFGQANYGAAKMGLVGMINTLAQEGAKYNIKANAVAPIAATRMTQDILPPEVFEKLTPEYVAPVVAYMCTEEMPETASVFIVGGGKVQRVALFQNSGVTFTECRRSTTSPASGARSPTCRQPSGPPSASADVCMKALVAQELSGPSGLAYADVDDITGGDAGRRRRRCGRGLLPGSADARAVSISCKMEPPFIPGLEVAGMVRSAPQDSGFRRRAAGLGVQPAGCLGRAGGACRCRAWCRLPQTSTTGRRCACWATTTRCTSRCSAAVRCVAGETVLVLGSGGGVGHRRGADGEGVGRQGHCDGAPAVGGRVRRVARRRRGAAADRRMARYGQEAHRWARRRPGGRSGRRAGLRRRGPGAGHRGQAAGDRLRRPVVSRPSR